MFSLSSKQINKINLFGFMFARCSVYPPAISQNDLKDHSTRFFLIYFCCHLFLNLKVIIHPANNMSFNPAALWKINFSHLYQFVFHFFFLPLFVECFMGIQNEYFKNFGFRLRSCLFALIYKINIFLRRF